MDKLIKKKLRKAKVIILIFALLLLLIIFFVTFHESRIKAAFVIADVPPVNEYIPLDNKIPLIKINRSKFHNAKVNLKETLEEDNSMIDFYKKVYEKSEKYNYDEIEDE